jgi:hypothetical protein
MENKNIFISDEEEKRKNEMFAEILSISKEIFYWHDLIR